MACKIFCYNKFCEPKLSTSIGFDLSILDPRVGPMQKPETWYTAGNSQLCTPLRKNSISVYTGSHHLCVLSTVTQQTPGEHMNTQGGPPHLALTTIHTDACPSAASSPTHIHTLTMYVTQHHLQLGCIILRLRSPLNGKISFDAKHPYM